MNPEGECWIEFDFGEWTFPPGAQALVNEVHRAAETYQAALAAGLVEE